jgi:hypothetical protein
MVKSIWSAPAKDAPSCHEGAKVNKNDSKLLRALEKLNVIIAQYDPENVNNMDETGLFFRLLLKYLCQMMVRT